MTGLSDVVTMVTSRFSTNVQTSFSNLSAQQWIRLIVVAGAYMLLRPYIIKLGGHLQMKQHEADEKESEEEAAAIAAGEKPALSANDLRGGTSTAKSLTAEIGIPDSDDDESDADTGVADTGVASVSGSDWGKAARKRQRRVLRKLLEAHEQQLADEQADEEDKEIQEFLVD